MVLSIRKCRATLICVCQNPPDSLTCPRPFHDTLCTDADPTATFLPTLPVPVFSQDRRGREVHRLLRKEPQLLDKASTGYRSHAPGWALDFGRMWRSRPFVKGDET